MKRISRCHNMGGKPKKRIFSPGEVIGRIQSAYEKDGKIIEAYKCECGYVHVGGRKGVNTKKLCAGRLGELKRMGIV